MDPDMKVREVALCDTNLSRHVPGIAIRINEKYLNYRDTFSCPGTMIYWDPKWLLIKRDAMPLFRILL